MKRDAARAGRSILPALVAGGVAFALLLGPSAWARMTQPAANPPVFPSTVGSYSWWTAPLEAGEIDRSLMAYQNGVGVEFMDSPQAVVLGADGATYRRLGAAEARTIIDDQGDPADMLLSADGTFVVVAGADGHGDIEVVTFEDGLRRSVAVGTGLSAIPLSIDAAGERVLIMRGDTALSAYTGAARSASLALVDLGTAEVSAYPDFTGVFGAAFAPEGGRIAVASDAGLSVIGPDGEVAASVPFTSHGLDGDAWSPDGTRLAAAGSAGIDVFTVADSAITVHTVPVEAMGYGTVIGWRDAGTVLLHSTDGGNSSRFSWVDLGSGDVETFAVYDPDFTGATLAVPDVARALVPQWSVVPREPDRGGLALLPPLVAVLVVGVLAWLLTPRRRRSDAAASDPRSPVHADEEAATRTLAV